MIKTAMTGTKTGTESTGGIAPGLISLTNLTKLARIDLINLTNLRESTKRIRNLHECTRSTTDLLKTQKILS